MMEGEPYFTRQIYIAGPMTGLKDHGYRAFHEAAGLLRGSGYSVINPAEQTYVPNMSWDFYIRRSLALLLTCTAVALLDGWDSSDGAKIEYQIAADLNMDCRPLHEWLFPSE